MADKRGLHTIADLSEVPNYLENPRRSEIMSRKEKEDPNRTTISGVER